MRFETAIEHLVDNYRYAKSKVWIRDKVAWALYHTWKEADDRKTEPSDSEKPNNCEDDKCNNCMHMVFDGFWYCECRECRYEPKDEPQTERSE